MKVNMITKKEVDIQYIKIILPIWEHGDEIVPEDYPLRKNNNLELIINIDDGKIENWKPLSFLTQDKIFMKIRDEGIYSLLDKDKNIIKTIENCYVPNCLPNQWGDYIDLIINNDGKIINFFISNNSFKDFLMFNQEKMKEVEKFLINEF